VPDHGYYEKVPRPESIEKLIEYVSANKVVTDVKRESTQVILVERETYSSLRVFMTNIYIVGLADVHDILTQAGEVNAIVTMSAWNGYTSEAKQFCKDRRIGLFKFKEFLGAVYYDGDGYLNYIPPDKR
jgi:hypothetical protein